MGIKILRGVSSALVVTVITLLAGMIWSTMGYGGLDVTRFIDIGLVVSCITAGYRTGKESGVWFVGGIAALGFVSLSIVLTALFLPVSGWGAVQILVEGTLIGLLAGAFGAGKRGGSVACGSSWDRPIFSSSSFRGEERAWASEDPFDDYPEPGRDVYEGIAKRDIAREASESYRGGRSEKDEWAEWMGETISRPAPEARVKAPEEMWQEPMSAQQRTGKNVWWEEDF